jgi:hypothetical protein
MICSSRAAQWAFSLTAIVCAASTPAGAQVADPIEISGCSPVFGTVDSSPYAVGFPLQTGLEIRFVNHADTEAREVTFRLGDGPDAETVVDRGRFAPGVTIRTVFDTTPRTPSTCRVATARFADDSASGITADR